jgi:hypothetical protein
VHLVGARRVQEVGAAPEWNAQVFIALERFLAP